MSFTSLILLFCLEALFSLGPEELGSLEDKDKPDAKVLNLWLEGFICLFVCLFWSTGNILRKELSCLFIEIDTFIIYQIRSLFLEMTWPIPCS